MSVMLQIIAVMKTLGAITPKDHSIAPVNQGTMEMDTIVQVKSSALVWLTYPLVSFKKLLGKIKFRAFPKRVGSRILSLKSVDYFGTSEHY